MQSTLTATTDYRPGLEDRDWSFKGATTDYGTDFASVVADDSGTVSMRERTCRPSWSAARLAAGNQDSVASIVLGKSCATGR